MKKNEVLEKIRKCLALAESDNEHESQSAMLRAQKLMIKYHIKKHEIENTKQEEVKNVKTVTVIYKVKRIMWYESYLANIIDKNFRIVAFASGNRDTGRSLKFLGLSEDVEVAIEVFDFAKKSMLHLANLYLLKNDIPKEKKSKIKNDYFNGFLVGLDYAFNNQVEENGWGLILVKDAIVLQEANKLNLKIKKKTGIPPKFDGDTKAYNEGYKDGKRIGGEYKDDILPEGIDETLYQTN